VSIVLIGNKCDLESKKVVEESRGRELAEEYSIPFFQTSAKADINVQEAFTCLVNAVCQRLFADQKGGKEKSPAKAATDVDIDKKPDGGGGSKCCK